MVSIGIIAKVDVHTPQFASMVIVPKRDRVICISVSLKPPDEKIPQEVHPLSKVNDTLAQLAGEKFSAS